MNEPPSSCQLGPCYCCCYLASYLKLAYCTMRYLCIWTRRGNRGNGVGTNSSNHIFELLRFYGSHFFCLLDLQFILVMDEFVLCLSGSCKPFQLRLLHNTRRDVYMRRGGGRKERVDQVIPCVYKLLSKRAEMFRQGKTVQMIYQKD